MIYCAMRAVSRETWIAAWQWAGILDADGNLLGDYASDVQVSIIGTIEKDGSLVPGYHLNFRVAGATEAAMTAGLPQIADDGAPLSLFERTRAALVFGLTQQPADPVSGFPAGMRDGQGNSYCDPVELRSPTNVWA